uniref:Uncharacterized protein n=1 Tax=Haemonchus contortus TaxID=6289 RepID=A0A7I4YXN4_HAECO
MRWTCPTRNNTNPMLISLLFLAYAISVAQTEFKVRPVRLYGDAPYSHRRLYGIRRLKVIRPLLSPMAEVERTATVRRHQATDEVPPSYTSHGSRADVTPKAYDSKEVLPQTTEKPLTTTKSSSDKSQSLDDYDEIRRKKIEARWKRLGINLRTIQYPIRRGSGEKSLELQKLTTISKDTVVDRKSAGKQISDPSLEKDEIHVTRSPNTRKSVPSIVSDKNIDQPQQFRPRPRIHGPILGIVSSDGGDAHDTGNGDSLGGTQHQAIVVSSESEPPPAPPKAIIPLPRFASPVANPSPNSDYHSRTIPVFKSYKYAQKLSQRPRLRIRRPGEKSISENSIQEDPNLTPFQNSAKRRFGYGSHGGLDGPIPYPRTIRPVPTSVETPTPTTTQPTTTVTETTTTTTEAPPPEQSGQETEDSGAGFGFGPSELPPELANVGFGIGGNGINFNMPAAETPTSPPAPKPKRPKQRKQPNPEIFKEGEPLVIPQNSGLRPVAPPKEFLDGGGFGPSSGSFGGGFGGGSGSGFGGGGSAGDGPGGESGTGAGLGGSPTGAGSGQSPSSEAEPAPDLFTGDSALVPSKGPTGDGYGPPIFPGGAVPPPVPAVGLGGAAAGKSPYAAMMEPTENPPTTVKPSALLSMLNKADQGINQAITHFEQRTPLETAAIDILEVALGSQKLDSQAKLLGHVDRTIGLDNLQRIQRWANTAGAMDVFKEESSHQRIYFQHYRPNSNTYSKHRDGSHLLSSMPYTGVLRCKPICSGSIALY